MFLAVLGARQVLVDCELLDALASPLKGLLQQWLQEGEHEESTCMSLETIGDLFSALASSGIGDPDLASSLSAVFAAQFREDVLEGRFSRSAYHVSDLGNVAHAAAALGGASGDLVQLVWTAAAPKLRGSEPHLALMLLNAVVRAGPDDLVSSEALLGAVDELLAQKLDYEPEVLGNLG